MIKLVTFTDDQMTIASEKLVQSAKQFGVEQSIIVRPEHFDFVFKSIIDKILPGSRGYGWWQWKSWAIMGAIANCEDGEYLLYCDAGNEIVAPIQNLVDAMDEDIMLFSNGWQHSHWCKRETAVTINPWYFPDPSNKPDLSEIALKAYESHKQVQASSILFKVNEVTRSFIQEWYSYCIMPDMIDNTPRGPQFPEFAEHRHDQAILTCLQIKHGYKLNWFPSTTNHHQTMGETRYKETFFHHRRRNHDY